MKLPDSRFMKSLLSLSRLFVGAVFVFSGFVKAIDPSGSAIKFMEYYDAFHLGFLHFSAFPLAIFLSSMEMMLGINLIASLRMKLTSWLLLVFMSFFAVLTLILAVANPVSDCGCFGDAIKLTNWETFWKNIILIIPSLLIFLGRKSFKPLLRTGHEYMVAGSGFIAAILLSAWCMIHLPLIDFRPYRTGTNIPDGMIIPEGAPLDEYETILVYEKDGEKEEFTAENFPWQDSAWVWVETRQKLISKGYEPPIHDFSISTQDGIDITETVLSDTGYTMLLISHSLDQANKKFMQQANILAAECDETGIGFICLTSSPDSRINSYIEANHPGFGIYTTDETTLKTVIRSNPGILLLREGTILGKWNFRDAPDVDELKNDMTPAVLSLRQKKAEWIRTITFFTGLVLLIGGLVLLLKTSPVKSQPVQ